MLEKIKELVELDPTLIPGAMLAVGVWILLGLLRLRDHLADIKRRKGYEDLLREDDDVDWITKHGAKED